MQTTTLFTFLLLSAASLITVTALPTAHPLGKREAEPIPCLAHPGRTAAKPVALAPASAPASAPAPAPAKAPASAPARPPAPPMPTVRTHRRALALEPHRYLAKREAESISGPPHSPPQQGLEKKDEKKADKSAEKRANTEQRQALDEPIISYNY